MNGPLLELNPQGGFIRRTINRTTKSLSSRSSDQERIERFLRKNDSGIVLAQFLNCELSNFLSLKRQGRIKWYAHAHGYDLSLLWRRQEWRDRYRGYAEADGVIVVNKLMRERLLSIGVPSELIHVVPYGVDVPSEPMERAEKESVVFLAVGRLTPKKAPLKTLEAFRQVSREMPSARLRYIGSGELLDAVRRFIGEHCLTDKVTLLGVCDTDTVSKEMRAADIFVQHSMVSASGDEEGLPVAILEAMAAGLPVVATRHAGIPDVVQEGRTGYLVDEGDSSAMAAAMHRLAASFRTRREFGTAAYDTVRTKFTWAIERDHLLKILGLTN